MNANAVSTKIVDVINPAQCRAARALLDINQSILAQHAGLGLSTIVDFEKERRQVSVEAVQAIEARLSERELRSLKKMGVERVSGYESHGGRPKRDP